jgi:RyR domain
MPTYAPGPIDTCQVQLSRAQQELVERLAAHAHDVWAKKRIADGWQYGSSRNDEAKTHPCLVPYVQLPENEKDYDRVMVEQVVKAAIAIGYRITDQ